MEWVVISFSRNTKESASCFCLLCICKAPQLSRVQACVLRHFRHIQLSVTSWTAAGQAPPSMGFSRQEYWSGLTCAPPGDLPNPVIELMSLMSPAFSGGLVTTRAPREAPSCGRLLRGWPCVISNYCPFDRTRLEKW